MMPESDNLSVLIGASPRVENLRQRLVRSGLRDLGVATSLPGLRRELHAAGRRLVVGCLLLDEIALERDGDTLRGLLADTDAFPTDFRCVGLVPNAGLIYDAARIGCHVYVQDPRQVLDALDALSRLTGPAASAPRAQRIVIRPPPRWRRPEPEAPLRRRLMDDMHTDRFDSW